MRGRCERAAVGSWRSLCGRCVVLGVVVLSVASVGLGTQLVGAPAAGADCVTTSTTGAFPEVCGNSDSDTEGFVAEFDGHVLPALVEGWFLICVPLLGLALLIHHARRSAE